MNIEVTYLCSPSYAQVKKATRSYFKYGPYIERNNVFSYPEADTTFYISKNIIKITVESSQYSTQKRVVDYLKFVFGKEPIYIRSSIPGLCDHFEGLNVFQCGATVQ